MLNLLAATLLGLVLGSFLNVCIYRLPRDQSIITPPSRCPHCHHPLAWYDKIPLLSYLLLSGRCRHCHRVIHWRYPAVELGSAVIAAGCGWWWLLDPRPDWFHFSVVLIFMLTSLAMALIDWEFSIIPNELSYGLALLGLVLGGVPHYPLAFPADGWFSPAQFQVSLLGGFLGGGMFFLLAVVSPVFYGKRALGMGDVKLIAAYGLWVGPRLVFLIMFLGSASGALVGTLYMYSRGKSLREEIPFGPFLCLAGGATMVWGPQILRWYTEMSYVHS